MCAVSSVAVILLVLSCVSAQNVEEGLVFSSCNELIKVLEPKNLDVKQLQGKWFVANKATFGSDSVATFTVTDDPSHADYTIYTNKGSNQTLQSVPDCIRNELNFTANKHATHLKTELFFADPRQNHVLKTTYLFDREMDSFWHADIGTEENDDGVLVLAVEGSKYAVLALCHDTFLQGRQGVVQAVSTTVFTLVRSPRSLTHQAQLEKLIKVSLQLGQQKFLAAQLDVKCSATCNLPFVISSLLLLLFSIFVL